MTNADYFAVATDVFLPPKNPGPAATIVTGMMGVHVAEMGRLHTVLHVQQFGSSIQENDHRRIRGPVP
jgi:hypothetical protein